MSPASPPEVTAHVHLCRLKIEGELRSPGDSGFFSRKAWHTVHSLLGVTKICSKNYRGHAEIIAEPALLKPANVPLSATLYHPYAQYHAAVTSGKAWGMVAVNGVLHLSTSLLLFSLLFIITARVPRVWFLFPLPRTRTNCVRAFEHINYLLMLTFEGDAVFVLAPTARVSRGVYITELLPRQQTEPQSQGEGECGGRRRNPWKWCETKAKQGGIQRK